MNATFSTFFEAVHQQQPFPWQMRLAEDVLKTGEFPSLISLPTASGKTALLDVADQLPEQNLRLGWQNGLYWRPIWTLNQAWTRAQLVESLLLGLKSRLSSPELGFADDLTVHRSTFEPCCWPWSGRLTPSSASIWTWPQHWARNCIQAKRPFKTLLFVP